jgi:quinol monooxygenase YgiN
MTPLLLNLNKMITRIVKLTIRTHEIEKFTTLFSNYKSEITNFKGCINVELFQQDNNGSVFFTYSKWDSLKAIEEYRSSITFKTIWSSVKPLFSEKAQAWSLEQIN